MKPQIQDGSSFIKIFNGGFQKEFILTSISTFFLKYCTLLTRSSSGHVNSQHHHYIKERET